jgi:5-methylcytosine-specific restriction endonuclease McrA
LQCLRCGKPKDLKAADLSEPQKQSAVIFDPSIEKAFWHERAEEYARLEQQMLARDRKEFVERYNRYLASPEWQKKRDLVLRRDSFLCQGCLHNRATQVHHLHYRRLFREMLFDLTSVCERCHKQVHLTGEELWQQL